MMIANLPLAAFVCINEGVAALHGRAILEGKLVNTLIIDSWGDNEKKNSCKQQRKKNNHERSDGLL